MARNRFTVAEARVTVFEVGLLRERCPKKTAEYGGLEADTSPRILIREALVLETIPG
jgi:hypothetical protein